MHQPRGQPGQRRAGVAPERQRRVRHILAHWEEMLRLATFIKQGTLIASRKLSSYPRQNGLAVAPRELGRIERNPFRLG